MINRVAIRADASNLVGAGHLMRCVALGQELKAQGSEVQFLTLFWNKALKEYLEVHGFECHFLALDTEALGRDEDLRLMFHVVKADTNMIILDNDYFDETYQKKLREKYGFLVVMDDQNVRNFNSDVVINHGANTAELGYPVTERRHLLGSQYALLRKELKRAEIPAEKGRKNILITMGASQQSETIEKLVEGISRFKGHPLDIRALGSFENLSGALELKSLYEWADIAVCAGGGTCWELCYFGVVGLVGALADSQVSIAKSLDRDGIFKYIGWYKDLAVDDITALFTEFLGDSKVLRERRECAMKLIDGEGAKRIVDVLEECVMTSELKSNKS